MQPIHIPSDRQIYLKTGRMTSSVNLTSTPFSITVIQVCSVTIIDGNKRGIILTRDTSHKPLQYFIEQALLGTVCYKTTFLAHTINYQFKRLQTCMYNGRHMKISKQEQNITVC